MSGGPRRFWLLAALGALVALGCRASAPEESVPTIEVARKTFSRVVEADGFLRPVKATPVTIPPQVQGSVRITWLAEDGLAVKKGEVVARFDDLEFRTQLASAQADSTVAAAKKQKERLLLETASEDRERTREAALRDLEMTRTFQRRDTAIFSRDQIIEAEIDEKLQEAKVEHAQKSETVDRQLGKKKLSIIDVEAAKAAEAIRRSQEALSALEVRAPHPGVFTLRRSWNGETFRVGDSVWRSQALGEVSQVGRMEAEVFVLEAEAAGLGKGRRAEVTVEARPEQPFAARVSQVEAVAKRRQHQSPIQYFGVVLSLAKTDTTLMKPGQRVTARLFLHEDKALVLPRPAVHDEDGTWVAFRRKKGGGFESVPVVLGPSTAGLVTVEKGLEPGDVVALRDPGRAAGELLSGPTAQGPGATPSPAGEAR